jgi:hypothetical protein
LLDDLHELFLHVADFVAGLLGHSAPVLIEGLLVFELLILQVIDRAINLGKAELN